MEMCVEIGFFFSKSVSVTSRLLERYVFDPYLPHVLDCPQFNDPPLKGRHHFPNFTPHPPLKKSERISCFKLLLIVPFYRESS